MAVKPWFVPVLVALITSTAGAIGGYFAQGAGSGAADIRSNEHRITQIEDDIRNHEREDDRATAAGQAHDDKIEKRFHDVWCAIRVNNHQPCSAPDFTAR